MKIFTVNFLVAINAICFANVKCEAQQKVQRVTVRPDHDHLPDFLTSPVPSTETASTAATPAKSSGRTEKERMDEERFKSVKDTESAAFWKDVAQSALKQRQTTKPIEKIAKNIVYFVGDGMSVPTITAARIFKGQRSTDYKFGEEAELHMDTFPFLGASKTFCSDAQVADSACSATALFCGSKTNFKTIGITPNVLVGDCNGQMQKINQLSSIIEWAQAAGKSTGIVTTTRITHATPAGTYAHIAHRDWENDAEVTKAGFDAENCDDIAEQLILSNPGKNLNVIMGGGRKHLLPSYITDSEGTKGLRNDSKNLIEQWKFQNQGKSAKYVENVVDLLRVDTEEVDYLLGLFAPDHIEYTDNLTMNHDPTLLNMTNIAIKILSKNSKGFVLMVEGGRVDHALHDNFGQRALVEAIELDKSIQHADAVTNDEDTLIVVTADHSHVMSIAGYPIRGNPILGIAENSDMDNLPYTTISFANGPGFRNHTNGTRPNIAAEDTTKIDYKQNTGIPMKYETHGGDDVFIFSKGPYAHLLTGVNYQNYIPHVMAFASCIAPQGSAQSPLCDDMATNEIYSGHPDKSAADQKSSFTYLSSLLLVFLLMCQVQNM